MTRRWIVLPVVGFGLIAGSVGSYAAWSNRTAAAEDAAEDDPAETREAVQAYVRASAQGRVAANQCFLSQAEDAAHYNDLPRLLAIYSSGEAPFHDSEDAALLLSRGLLSEDRPTELRHIRDLWRGREKRVSAWLALDADVLLAAGREDEARELLSGRSFGGAEDARRLARLALTATGDDPSAAQQLLGRATALAPDDPDVRACRSRFLEAEGRPGDAAAELTAALSGNSDDWLLRDQLAECYRRAGAAEAANATWLPGNDVPPADFAWLKAWFWNRVGRPIACDWEARAPDVGRLSRLAVYLLALPPEQFWVSDAESSGGPREPVVGRQETFWLRLLGLLQGGQDLQALTFLRTAPPYYMSWRPDLANALDRVLSLRTGKRQRPGAGVFRLRRHPFFEQLEALAGEGNWSGGEGNSTAGAAGLPDDVQRLLHSEEAVAAILLAAGWNEAALAMHHAGVDLSSFPAWYPEGLMRARWVNHGAGAALARARREPPCPAADLVVGEMLVAERRDADALERLRSAASSTDCGARAAWLFAVVAARQGKPAEARRMLEAYPQLTNCSEGQLLLARCAAAEGNEDRAERLYRELAGESAEARAYLARRAMAGGDWEAAARLTGGLLRDAGR
jgi:thioredoxin-like negative regulator of GroEL